VGRVASKPGPPWRNSKYGRSRPLGAASSRVKTVILAPSGLEWSSGTEWARSVRTAPGTRWVVAKADSPFVRCVECSVKPQAGALREAKTVLRD
jgi:hypothetical protein